MSERQAGTGAMEDDYQQLALEQAVSTERLVQELAISAGTRVLDIGCGTGPAAIAAARRRAAVTAIDIDEVSLARARQRADTEGVGDIDFRNADARQMPFNEGSFDVVLSTLGLVFLPDQEGAARELARVVRPGGQIALTAYCTQSIPSQVFDLIRSLLNAPKTGALPHYCWSQGPHAGIWLNPYFENVRVRYDSFDSCYVSTTAAFEHVARWNRNIRKLVATFPPEKVSAFREGYLAIIDRHNRATDGTFVANMDYAIITGTRRH